MIRFQLLVALFCTALLWQASAVRCAETAQNSNDADADVEAKIAFQEGTDFFNKGEYLEAAKRFRTAQALRPSWKIWYNIGHAESAAKRFGRALVAFELYVAEGGDEVPEDRLTVVLEEIRRLHVLVGSVAITAPDGAEVIIDDELYGITPLTGDVKLAAGNLHEIEIVLDGDVILKQTVRLSGGDRLAIEGHKPESETVVAPPLETIVENDAPDENPPVVSTVPAETDTPVAPTDTSKTPIKRESVSVDRHRALRISGWTLLSVGSATAIAGGVLGAVALSKARQLDTLCTSNHICESDDATNTYDDSILFGKWSTALLAAGSTVAVSGLIFLIAARLKEERAESSQLFLRVVPTASGAILTGRF